MSTSALVIIGAVYVVRQYQDTSTARARARVPARAPNAAPTPAPALAELVADEPISGLRISDDGIRIYDWGRWVPFARKSMRQAIMLGKLSPEEILEHMMRLAHPEHTWPPPPNSPLSVDYSGMLAVLSSQITPDPLPETRPHLRVVT